MKIGFYPYESDDNMYLSIVINNIEKNGAKVEPFTVSIINWILGKYELDVVHFNWFDNIDARTTFKTLLRFGKRILILGILKARGVKIVVTVHNKMPHNTRFRTLAKLFLKILYTCADAITILSNDTINVLREILGEKGYQKIEKNIVTIAHPNYIGVYPASGKSIFVNEQDKMRCLFLGAVKPYKNIELILEVASELYFEGYDIDFVIAGGGDKKYLKTLEKEAAKVKNIHFIGRFIENEEVGGLISNMDILVLPYDMKSSLNSGSCYLAFSYGKSVVCPLIGTIKEVGEENCYSYSYVDENDHKKKLKESLIRAYEDYNKPGNELKKKGKRLLDKVIEENEPQEIGYKYVELYNQILK